MSRPEQRAVLIGKASKKVLAAVWVVTGLLTVPMAHGRIIGINHTHWAINHFSVDGRSGLDIIGPWQGGGGGHYSLPSQWHSEMMVRVDWETGVAGTAGFPGFVDRPRYKAWIESMEKQNRQHTKQVSVPDYTNQKVCGVTVHFLPCDEIQVTTSCYGYGHPDYPIKIPLRLPEPASCPVVDQAPVDGALQ